MAYIDLWRRAHIGLTSRQPASVGTKGTSIITSLNIAGTVLGKFIPTQSNVDRLLSCYVPNQHSQLRVPGAGHVSACAGFISARLNAGAARLSCNHFKWNNEDQ